MQQWEGFRRCRLVNATVAGKRQVNWEQGSCLDKLLSPCGSGTQNEEPKRSGASPAVGCFECFESANGGGIIKAGQDSISETKCGRGCKRGSKVVMTGAR